MQISNKTKGYFSLASGFLVHLVIGCFYLWGTMVLYVTSYFRHVHDKNLETKQALSVFPIMLFGIVIGFPFGLKIMDKIGFRLSIFIEGTILCLAVFISSFMKNFYLFTVFYAIGFGLMAGFMYIIPVYNSVRFFPDKKGLISGLIVGAFGLATVIANFIVQEIVNPKNKKTNEDKYFDWEVAKNIPRCLRILSIYFYVLIIVAVAFGFSLDKKEKNSEINETSNLNNNENINETEQFIVKNSEESENDNKQVLLSLNSPNKEKTNETTSKYHFFYKKEFWFLFLMIFFGSGFGLLIAVNFKNFPIEQKKIKDDEFLTIVGSFGALSNALTRLLWGYVLDKISFKYVYSFLIIMQLLLISTLYAISEIKILYLIWVFFILACEGGHFALFPAESMKVFGVREGANAYSYIYSAFGFANILQFGIVFFCEDTLKFQWIFWIYFGISFVSLVLVILYKGKKN